MISLLANVADIGIAAIALHIGGQDRETETRVTLAGGAKMFTELTEKELAMLMPMILEARIHLQLAGNGAIASELDELYKGLQETFYRLIAKNYPWRKHPFHGDWPKVAATKGS